LIKTILRVAQIGVIAQCNHARMFFVLLPHFAQKFSESLSEGDFPACFSVARSFAAASASRP
jgi:hypothetical protein